MATSKSLAAAATALLVVLALVLEAQAQCPSALQLQLCQNAVTGVNQTPSLACCQKVQAALQVAGGDKCLCTAMTSPTAKAFKVITAEAVKLPSKCKKLMGLNYNPGYNCAGSIVP